MPAASVTVALVAQQAAQTQRDAQAVLNLPLPLGWDFDKIGAAYDRRDWPTPGTMLMVLAGWLITALASTLGAPFWFDLLSRLVPLRSSGKPPPSSAGGSPASPVPATPPIPPAPAPAPANPASTSPAEGSGAGSPEDAVAGTGWTATGTVTPGAASSPGARNDFEARQLNELDLFALQRALGMDAGALSGHLDETTRQALRHWQIFQNLPANGEFDETAVMRLLYPDDASGG